ncbi:hypothetical protein PGT21_036566 [Puccinia graminis f. sp. tritici]|uniref:Uncharacterized protein n=1 Tax=Puccinia graminis f. sp. tritici TaxID=56615 RepID=A0A5B0PND7_PUCGR|nr:hypothetical protein PGT21_036566 [Puccinia graminis f. sp. tritici]
MERRDLVGDPLDRLDAYCEFAAVMKNIETSGHPVLNIITNSLSTDQRDRLQKILNKLTKEANKS